MATKIELSRSYKPRDIDIKNAKISLDQAREATNYPSRGNKEYIQAQYEKKRKAYNWLRYHKLEIGLTSKASSKSKMLLQIHENGSPVNNIPARPFFRMALVEANLDIGKFLKMACEAASDGDLVGVQMSFKAAGQSGVNKIREKIDSRIPPPNAPITLHGGWMKNKKSGKTFYVEPKSGDVPLVNTGAFRDSFNYEITERK